jgi:hypothetical protein
VVPAGQTIEHMTQIQPPECVVLDKPGVVRWAVGSDNAPRSHTWRVEGFCNASGHDDIYVGTRRTMRALKISLHDAKPPRYSEPATVFTWDERDPANKLVTRKMSLAMERTPLVAHGWRHELEILTPTITFGTFTESPPLKAGEAIQWWTPPRSPEQLSFHLYIGDADSAIATFSDHIGGVCTMQPPMGARSRRRSSRITEGCETSKPGILRGRRRAVARRSRGPEPC